MKNEKSGIYFDNLDGLRALAAFSVVFFHIAKWLKFPHTNISDGIRTCMSFNGEGGVLGVYFFFVLSGFLITYLMFVEKEKTDKFNIVLFYLRRSLRIWPLYFLTLIVGFLIWPQVAVYLGITYHETANWLTYSLFLANFDHIYGDMPANGMLGVQWSVAIEEQFYFLWPILFILSNKKTFPWILLLILISSELFFVFNRTWDIRYYHTLSVMRYLAFGAMLAYVCYNKFSIVTVILKKFSKTGTLFTYLAFLCLLFFQNQIIRHFHFYYLINHIVPFLFFGFIIIEQNYSANSFLKFGKFFFLNWLGKISYGLYLTHMIAIYIVLYVCSAWPLWMQIVLSLLLTIVISFISYRYYESYFLRAKEKFTYIKTSDNGKGR